MSSNYWLILLFCSTNGLTFSEDLQYVKFDCSQQRVGEIRVFGAFRLGSYIGLMAELYSKDQFANNRTIYRSIFRVLYSGMGNLEVKPWAKVTTRMPGAQVNFYPFVDFQQFDENIFGAFDQEPDLPLQQDNPSESKNFNLMTAFDTENLVIFKRQKIAEIVYINDTNGVTAYEIEVERRSDGSVHFQLRNKRVVYFDLPHKTQYVDHSGELNLYSLFLYFPHSMYIDAILIVEKPKILYKHRGSYIKEYIALVYTRVIGPNNNVVKMRQRMVASDRTERNRLIWNFDTKSVYCERIIFFTPLRSAVFLTKERHTIQYDDGTEKSSETEDIFFMEVTLFTFRVLRMRYNVSTELLDINSVIIDPKAREWMSVFAFFNCTPDPYHWSYKRLPCASKEPQYLYDEIPGVEKDLTDILPKRWFDDNTTHYLLLIASIIVVIIIVVVLSFGVYFMATGPQNDN